MCSFPLDLVNLKSAPPCGLVEFQMLSAHTTQQTWPGGEELKISCQCGLVLQIMSLQIFSLRGTFLIFPYFLSIYTYWQAQQAELGKKKDSMLLMLLMILWTVKMPKWRKSVRNKNNFTLPHCLFLWSFTRSLPLLQHYSHFRFSVVSTAWTGTAEWACNSLCCGTWKWHLRNLMLLFF